MCWNIVIHFCGPAFNILVPTKVRATTHCYSLLVISILHDLFIENAFVQSKSPYTPGIISGEMRWFSVLPKYMHQDQDVLGEMSAVGFGLHLWIMVLILVHWNPKALV